MINDERCAKIDFVKPHAMLRGVFIVPDKSAMVKNRWKLIIDGLGVTILISLLSLFAD